MKKEELKFWRGEIEALKERLPEGQYLPGLFIDKIGYKYVTVLDIHNGSFFFKIDLEEFVEWYKNSRHYLPC